MRRLLAVLLPAAVPLLFTLTGCGPGKTVYPVKGKLCENGTPVTASTEGLPPGTHPIQIIFHEEPPQGQSAGEAFYSEVNSDTGEFSVKGPSGDGIPPGKYRVSVTVQGAGKAGTPMVPNSAGVMGLADRYKGAFDAQRTRLEVEITKPTQLVIDVGANAQVTVQ